MKRHVLLAATVVIGFTSTAASGLEVTIDHNTGVVRPAGLLELAAAQLLTIRLEGTSVHCYHFNQSVVTPRPDETTPMGGATPSDIVEWSIIHDGTNKTYVISATKKPGFDQDDACKDLALAPGPWAVRVVSYDWAVGLAGAFTGDSLTDPVFYLEPGEATPPGGGGAVSGYFVRQDDEKQDSLRLGLSAMIHLYHTDPNRFAVARAVNWVPVTFGLGIQNSGTRYYLGTGCRFGTKLFAGVGLVAGSVNRLSDGLSVGSFTTHATALDSLPTRTKTGGFLFLSYSFLDVGPSPFGSGFPASQPTPAETAKGK